MMRHARIAAILGILILIPPFLAYAQSINQRVYAYGPSMVAWMLFGKEKVNEGPLEFFGYRQEIVQILANSPMTVSFIDDKALAISYDGTTLELEFKIVGQSLYVKNLKTGKIGELGTFNKDQSTLTITKQYILDRAK